MTLSPARPTFTLPNQSDDLYPVFANRVMPRSRPEFDVVARRVDLAGDADPFEVLARAGGRRATDRIEVFLPPEPARDGHSCVLFFARGIRHGDGAAEAVSRLRPGDELVLVDDGDNQYNHRAVVLRVVDGQRVADGQPVGWVPDYLVEHVHELRQLNGSDPTVVVEQRSTTPRCPPTCDSYAA